MKNYLNDLVQHLQSGLVFIDVAGIIQLMNNSFGAMFEIDRGTLIGRHYSVLENVSPQLYLSIEKVIKAGIPEKEYELETTLAEDKKLAYNSSVMPLVGEDGLRTGIVCILEDISQERRIRDNLIRYLPRHLVNKVVNHDDLSLLDGTSKQCSILFSDIRDFTALTEKLGPRHIIKLLNSYFQVMVESIYKNHGIPDKFLGDAIMAVFGVPFRTDNDAINAVATALDMFVLLEKVNTQRKLEHKIPIKIGVGVSTGNVIAGNIGAEKRFDYTVIGDSVNIAASLEEATKVYGIGILICNQTYELVKEKFVCREIDKIMVKGKKQATTLYAVTGSVMLTLSEEEKHLHETYKKALGLYKKQQFQEAKSAFKLVNRIAPQDQSALLMTKRCAYLEANPPDRRWNGIWAWGG